MSPEDLVESYRAYLREKEEQGYLPVTALDYSSLYPSLIMAYNLSPEYLVTEPEHKDQLASEGYDIHPINFVYNYTDVNEESHSKDIVAWTVRHDVCNDNVDKKRGSFGLYPEILQDLFNQRAEMKKSLAIYKEKKEHLEKHSEDYASSEEYQECLFNLKYCDTKQKALKVYMNCFYGELGNKNSPLFILELAGGITSAGQDNLRKVKKFIESKGCRIYYGDTDSLYFSFSKKEFADPTQEYIVGNCSKEKYCTELVDKTFGLVKSLSKEVNQFLVSDNGTRFLKMAYEEVLFPVGFLSRKKYYGIAHEGLVNFKPSEMFIRGLEVKKRGVSQILRIVCLETMWESMSIFNNKTLLDLVIEKIDYVYTKEWNIADFQQTAIYKPGKNNVPVIRFRERMIEELREPPIPFERFNYVVTKIMDFDRLYTYKGTKKEIKKGDRMEYLSYALQENLPIDLDYYFEKQLTTQFARLICYDKQFNAESDDDILSNCKRFITQYAKKYSSESQESHMRKENHKEMNRNRSVMVSKDKKLKVLFNETSSCHDRMKATIEKAESMIDDCSIDAEAKNILKDLDKTGINITKMYSLKTNKKANYISRMNDHLELEASKLSVDLVKYCDKSGISPLIFNMRYIGDDSDKSQECKKALWMLADIAACIRQKKVNEKVRLLNLERVCGGKKKLPNSKPARKELYTPPEGFTL